MQLEHLDEGDPPLGMIKYEELISSGILDGADMELSANVAAITAPPDDPHDGSFGADKIRDEMIAINHNPEIRGARSSHQQPVLTRSPIDTIRVGLKLLAPDLAKHLVLASQNGLHSEQNSPGSESNLCITCYKPKSITYDSVKVDGCVCDNNEPSVVGDNEPNTQAEDLPHKSIPPIDSETAVINRFRDEIITECIDCEFCGSSIM